MVGEHSSGGLVPVLTTGFLALVLHLADVALHESLYFYWIDLPGFIVAHLHKQNIKY